MWCGGAPGYFPRPPTPTLSFSFFWTPQHEYKHKHPWEAHPAWDSNPADLAVVSEEVWRRRGSEEGEAGRRVQEVQTQTPRSGFTDPRWKVREKPNAGVRSQIPRLDFVVYRGPEEVPEKVPVSRDVDRPVTIKARVKEKFFWFSEASASFHAERFFL
ncbi:hypothetical protein GEV33_004645 [Tenebrio molitor]|uniref:Uncharacterized protein n=1 Tax=Tenebrio molitor TaxID=7067 RepID=A0A8J6HMV1_TENMO|nr:hypothetical protein GEV33_004645 [Tenebrio molitor]